MKWISFLVLSVAACQGGSTPVGGGKFLTTNEKKGGPVIVRIGDETITADEVTARLNEKSPFERQRFRNPDLKKEFVENLARGQLLALEAASRGLDKDPDVVRAAQQVMVRKLVAQEVDDNPAKRNISDDELKAYYDAHHDDYVKPEMVRVSAILLGAADAQAAHARLPDAQKLLSDLHAAASDYSAFGRLAQQKSDDQASKAMGGDLHPLSQDELASRTSPEVAKAAFALLKSGDLSDPIETPKGVWVLKLVQKTAAINQPFERVKPQIQNRLSYEKRNKLYEAFLEDLKKKYTFSIDEAELAKLEVQPTAPSTPLGAPPPPGIVASGGVPPPHPSPAPAPAAPAPGAK